LFDAVTGGSLPADGATVARWADKSGRGNHATQDASGNDQPLRRARAANGLDALEFDGVNDFMTIGGTPLSTATAASLFIVSDKLSSKTESICGISSVSANNHHPYSDGVFYDSFCIVSRTSWVMAERLDRWVFAVTSGGTYRAYADGQQVYSATIAFAAPTRYLIGGDAAPTFGGNYQQISEVLLYDRQLTAVEVTAVYRYLRNKWNTA